MVSSRPSSHLTNRTVRGVIGFITVKFINFTTFYTIKNDNSLSQLTSPIVTIDAMFGKTNNVFQNILLVCFGRLYVKFTHCKQCSTMPRICLKRFLDARVSTDSKFGDL